MLTLTDHLNSNQIQTFTYDALNRLETAATNGLGQGQYTQSYQYGPATGNLSNKSDVGGYIYSQTQPHAVTGAGTNSYTYDLNGNMKTRTVAGNLWTYIYNAEGKITAVRKNGQLISEYSYDGDGKRVAEINADGTATIFIGNYFEGAYPEPPPQPPQPLKFYMPFVSNAEEATDLFEPITARMGTLYFYADGQRIAMKKDGVVSCIYGDQLGSVSAVADAGGNLISKTLYHPWGTTRYAQGTSPTDYGYTGQMKEGDIYFYNARWYDPQLGRFMQADTIVPTVQGTQGFDRYAYVNNNPMRSTDPTGHRLWEGDAGGERNWHYDYVMNVLHSSYEREQNAKVANAVLEGTLIAGSVLFEPMDWAVTASECISGDCSPWALLGLLPYIPGMVGNKADDIIDIGKHLGDIPLHGQKHHIFSKKIWNAMSDSLKKAFDNNRNSLIVQAVDYAAHHGYQDWHRAIDDELRDFVISNAPTMPKLIDKLVEVYTPLVDRFPTVLDILKRYR